jgi:hypothetical protein
MGVRSVSTYLIRRPVTQEMCSATCVRGQQDDPLDPGRGRAVEQGADVASVLRLRDGAGDQEDRVHALARGLIRALVGSVEAGRLDARPLW